MPKILYMINELGEIRMQQIQIKARAKINLTIDVIGKRPDGYHEVSMVMQTIDLHDLITLTAADSGITVSANRLEVPTGSENLVYKAAELIKPPGFNGGVQIHIEKNIPMAAGLAGGSADAAAVLEGLNQLWELKLTREELMKIGSQIGSDVPFCVLGGTALAEGRGEKLTPLPEAPEIWLVLAKPPVGVSTKDVYGQYNPCNTSRRPDNNAMIRALAKGDKVEIMENLVNVLESVTLHRYPEVAGLKQLMVRSGAQAALMSGSGPTVFGVVPEKAAALEVVQRLRKEFSDGYTNIARTCFGNGRKSNTEGE